MIVTSSQQFKGGSGKSASTYHLATALAIQGARVLAIDADPQGNLTEMAGLRLEPAFHDFLVRDADYKDVLRVVDASKYTPPGMKTDGRLYVIPGDEETRVISQQIGELDKLHWRLRDVEDRYDYVLIDTSPTPTFLHTSIYLASDYVLMPTKCEWLHFDGLMRSLKFRDSGTRQREAMGIGGVKMLGIVPTMYRASTLEHTDMLTKLTERFQGAVWDAVGDRILWAEAARMHQPVFKYAPDSRAAFDAWRLSEQFLERIHAA